MPYAIDLRSNFDKFSQGLDDFARRQVPFATAQTLTAIARKVAAGERQNMAQTFDNPRPFTLNSIGVIGARKDHLVASVFIKDAQAQYIAPSILGDDQFLGKGKRIRTPVDIGTNSSGDIPLGKIAQLLSTNKAFIGHVGGVGGVWQRAQIKNPGSGRGGRGMKRMHAGAGARQRKLQLLIAFTKPKPVKTKLNWFELAPKLVNANLVTEWDKAFRQAMSTAR